MDLSTKIRFNEKDLIIYEKNKLVVIYNKKFSRHILLSEEVYNFYKIASKENLTIDEFLERFYDEDDKIYIEKVSKNMIKSGAIYNEEYEKYINQKNNPGESIYICITNKCNLRCKHCCTSCSIENQDFLNILQIKNIIDLIKVLNPSNIVITGGEPLIREDFNEIINYINNKIPNSNLILSTNGTLINSKNIDFIVKNFKKIDISIDGVDEETCSLTRGKGIFNKVINAINELQKKKFTNISLSMVFGDKNEYLRESFLELNKKLKTQPIERYFVPLGRGLENISLYSSDEMLTPIVIPKIFEKNRDEKSKKISSCNCSALQSQIFINYDGTIYPCQSLIKDEYAVGSIFDNYTIHNIKDRKLSRVEAYKNVRRIHPYNFEKCKRCDVNIFCWHCPALLDGVKENNKEFDKWCSLMKVNLNRIIWNER